MPKENDPPATRDEYKEQENGPESQAIETFLRSLPPELREKIEALPPDGRGTLLEITASFSYTQGPYPPAETIKAYEEILPGAADRVFRLPERQQEIQAETNQGLLVSPSWREYYSHALSNPVGT